MFGKAVENKHSDIADGKAMCHITYGREFGTIQKN